VGNDLSLLGDLDGTVDRPERLSEDRLVGGPTAPAHGAAAAVEEPKRHAVAAGGAAQRLLCLVDLPLGGGDSPGLVGVRGAEQHLLDVPAQLQIGRASCRERVYIAEDSL